LATLTAIEYKLVWEQAQTEEIYREPTISSYVFSITGFSKGFLPLSLAEAKVLIVWWTCLLSPQT